MILRQVTAFVMLKFLNFSQCWGGLRAATLLFRDAGCKCAKKKILKTVSVTPSDLVPVLTKSRFSHLGRQLLPEWLLLATWWSTGGTDPAGWGPCVSLLGPWWRGAAGWVCCGHCLESLSLPAWLCTGAPELPARISVCFRASPGLRSCLLHFLHPVGKENTCCETCSKKEVKPFLGFGITELAKSLQFNSLHCICYVE